ncbi:MAG: O-methyltransferase [Bacteroidales bacterium]|nr:O-methyltransferase [Bacteroidales bacterium]MBN2763208.1 O-methyltransferase [Bacteroidales bacterium]
MNNLDDKLLEYITACSSSEDPVLAELYRETHSKILYPRMISGHLQGKLLEFISRMIKPTFILEVGTFTGYSAICLAKGLLPGGSLHTIEINDELQSVIKKYITKAGLDDTIVLHTGDAREIIPLLKPEFDLVFLDADKQHYLDYYKAVYLKMRRGGYLIADNVLWGGKVINFSGDKETCGIKAFNEFVKNDDRVEKLMLPLRDGLMLVRKR